MKRKPDSEGVEAFPLQWPEGWTRTRSSDRRKSDYTVSFSRALDDVLRSLSLMRVPDYNVIISSNVPTRQDGLPYSNREPDDPGIAVYWTTKEHGRRVVACDTWRTVRENLRAVGLTLEALRMLQRTGASEILDRAFTGFAALPETTNGANWAKVLGFSTQHGVTVGDIEERYRELALKHHPDKGGDHEAMVRLNNARAEALKAIEQ